MREGVRLGSPLIGFGRTPIAAASLAACIFAAGQPAQAAPHLIVSGTIAVLAHYSDGSGGRFKETLKKAPARISIAILSYETPAQYRYHQAEPSCTGSFGDDHTPTEGEIALNASAERFIQALVMPAQLLGGGEGSHPCGTTHWIVHLTYSPT